eukprot:3092083-Rhodomonas_salina.2
MTGSPSSSRTTLESASSTQKRGMACWLGTIKLTQTVYINELLRKFKMEKCNPLPTPMVAHTCLSRSDCPEKPILGLG